MKVAVIRGPGMPGPYSRWRGKACLALDGHDTCGPGMPGPYGLCRGEACLALVNHDAQEH